MGPLRHDVVDRAGGDGHPKRPLRLRSPKSLPCAGVGIRCCYVSSRVQPPGETTPDELRSTVEELAAGAEIDAATGAASLLRRAAVLGDEFPEDLLVEMFSDVRPEVGNRITHRAVRPPCRPVTSSVFRSPDSREVTVYAGLPYRRHRRTPLRPLRSWSPHRARPRPPPRDPRSSLLRGPNYDKAMDYGWRAGNGLWHGMRPPPPPTRYRRAAQAANLPKR